MPKSKGMDRIPDKQRREERRRNHIAKDLWTPKFRPRVIPLTSQDDFHDWVEDINWEE